MGCDIHEMIEIKKDGYWENGGNCGIGRNYTIFSILADVRNADNIPCIDYHKIDLRNVDIDIASDEFISFLREWEDDAHSAGFVTLKQIKEYDINQKIYNHTLILSRDSNGNITSTCRGTNGEHLGEVGETTIFGVWGAESWYKIISHMEKVKDIYNVESDEDIRLSFFFDN